MSSFIGAITYNPSYPFIRSFIGVINPFITTCRNIRFCYGPYACIDPASPS